MYSLCFKEVPSEFDDEYDKYNFSSLVVNTLYILKLFSYIFSIVVDASSNPYCFIFSLSLSSIKPSSLFIFVNKPSLRPIINIALTLALAVSVPLSSLN